MIVLAGGVDNRVKKELWEELMPEEVDQVHTISKDFDSLEGYLGTKRSTEARSRKLFSVSMSEYGRPRY